MLLEEIRKIARLDTLWGQSGETTPMHYMGGAVGGSVLGSLLAKSRLVGAPLGAAAGVLGTHLLGDHIRKKRMAELGL